MPFILLVILFAIAQDSVAEGYAGESGFEFLSVQSGALPVSLAGAYTAGYGDAYALSYNPAGLSGIKSRLFSVDYLYYVLDIQRGMISFSTPIQLNKSFNSVAAAYINYLSAGSFDLVDIDGNVNGTFSSGSYEFGLSAGFDLPPSMLGAPIQVGATVKGLMEQVSTETWSAAAFDIGIQYLKKGGRIRFGAAIRNFGITLADQDSFSLPRTYALGMSVVSKSWRNAKFYTDLNIPEYGDFSLRTGVDMKLDKDMYLRVGYRFMYNEVKHWYYIIANKKEETIYERDEINTWSAGFGMRVARFYTMDFAVQGNSFQSMPFISTSFQYAWR